MNLRVDEGSLRVRVEQDEAKQLFLEGQLQRDLAFPALGGGEGGRLRLLLLCPPDGERKGEVTFCSAEMGGEPAVAVAQETREAGVFLRQQAVQELGLTMEITRSRLRGILNQLGLLEADGAALSAGLREKETIAGMGAEHPRKSKKQLELSGHFEIGGGARVLSFEVDCFPPKH